MEHPTGLGPCIATFDSIMSALWGNHTPNIWVTVTFVDVNCGTYFYATFAYFASRTVIKFSRNIHSILVLKLSPQTFNRSEPSLQKN